ncbi:unnamed protein product [Mycena citricolor]|uniref:Endonuclease/exonuclease/phosphatase domain-containing protein n=1 Tax=Mycena citricolor TaxID=2018698 RepID=A0AAD2H160_9AGAR|nr:unnamed protein product [Mycena citricolor]
MILLKDIPTLKAHAMGNYTCTDNVFCSEDMAENFITCRTAPTLRPTKTDHIPILFSFHLDVGNRTFMPRLNWRATDWQEFRKMLEAKLAQCPQHAIATTEDMEDKIQKVDEAVELAIKAHVPMSKPCPHSKRWWNPSLSEQRTQLGKAQNRSYARRNMPDYPDHEHAQCLQNTFSRAIVSVKKTHWDKWLDGLTEADIWNMQKLSGEPPLWTALPSIRHVIALA